MTIAGQDRRRARSTGARLVALLAVLGLAACGGGGYVHPGPYDEGYVFLWNRTNTTTFEVVTEFGMAPAGGPVPTDWVSVYPGEQVYLGAYFEDLYDAVAVLERGEEVWWFDVFVGDGLETVFEVF